MPRRLWLHARAARAEIASGALRGAALLRLLLSIPPVDRDAWLDEAFGLEALPLGAPELPKGCVPYLPCAVEELLAMLAHVAMGPDDVLVDVGAGLGRVALFVHLVTGARAVGVEIQGQLVSRARAAARALGASGVTFVHADAAETALEGSVFFLYAPCNGPMWSAVVARLEAAARVRPVVVCAVGAPLDDLAWIRPRAPASAGLRIYDAGA